MNTSRINNATSGKKVFVGLSGGVDSAVSAYLLKQAGYEVTGVFIRTWQPDFIACSQEDDRREAMRVAAHLDIPFKECDLTEVYRQEVVEKMLAAYECGETPNPDILCNRTVKFGAFADWAFGEGAEMLATGHYARITKDREGKLLLTESEDVNKDQTYFLWMIPRELYSKILFPIGGYTKEMVRSIAKDARLPNANRADSQGVCFLGEINMKEFLGHFLPGAAGQVLDVHGKEIGTHEGAQFYTLGERHGFRVAARNPHTPPYYVVAKDIKTNTITVASLPLPTKEAPTYRLREVVWYGPTECLTARVRHRGKKYPVSIRREGDTYFATFREPLLIAPGQSLVCYQDSLLVGGGIIAAG